MANSLIKFRLLIVFCLLLGVCLPGCGDLTNVGEILVSPANVTVGINQTQAFTALGRSAAGFLVSTTPTTWSVQGNIGTIKTATGLFTAGSVEGTGTVIATSNDLTGSAAVTITIKGWLTGNVTDTNGGLVVGIRVYLKELPLLGSETDSKGNYLISGIPAGTYEADIDARNLTAAGSAEVTIFQGQTQNQDFQLYTPPTETTTTTLPDLTGD
jgi:Carboxypeptidase regulatory-like domain